MGKKIVILNGSPRLKGNTAGLIEAFKQGAKEAGHTMEVFNLQRMDIHPCLGCLGGGKDRQSPCVQKDDMAKIYPHYETADVLALASPMYYWSITAQLKAVIDRLFAVTEKVPNTTPPCSTAYCSWRQRATRRTISSRSSIITMPCSAISVGRTLVKSMPAV